MNFWLMTPDEDFQSRLLPLASNILDQFGERNLPDLLAYLMQRPTGPRPDGS
jgi:hypothetical protein